MTPYAAQRIRFGILAARHMLERHRLTPGQVDDLESNEVSALSILFRAGPIEAYNREKYAAQIRRLNNA